MDSDVDHVTPSPIHLKIAENIDVFVVQSFGEPQQNVILEVGCHVTSMIWISPASARAIGPI